MTWDEDHYSRVETLIGLNLSMADFAQHGHASAGRTALVRLRTDIAMDGSDPEATYSRHLGRARDDLAAAKGVVTVDGGRRIEAAIAAVRLLESCAGEFR